MVEGGGSGGLPVDDGDDWGYEDGGRGGADEVGAESEAQVLGVPFRGGIGARGLAQSRRSWRGLQLRRLDGVELELSRRSLGL